MRKRLVHNVLGATLTVAVLLVSSPLAGQSGKVSLEPRVGWLLPTADLGRTDILGNSGFGVFERVDPSAILGLAGGVSLGNRWALRASFDHFLDANVQGEWRCVPFVACPAVLLPLEGELTRWTATVDGLYRVATGTPVEPILFAGFGVGRSALDWNQPAADVPLPAFSFVDLHAVYRFGMALVRTVGPLQMFGEFAMMTTRFGGGGYESIEGNVPAERPVAFELGLVGGLRVRLR